MDRDLLLDDKGLRDETLSDEQRAKCRTMEEKLREVSNIQYLKDFDIVFEGVETRKQLLWTQALFDNPAIQGWGFHKPMSQSHARFLVHRHNTDMAPEYGLVPTAA